MSEYDPYLAISLFGHLFPGIAKNAFPVLYDIQNFLVLVSRGLRLIATNTTLHTKFTLWTPKLSPFSTRRLFSREATFSFVGIAFADVISDADKGKSRFARKKSPSGKRALQNLVKTLLGTLKLSSRSAVLTSCAKGVYSLRADVSGGTSARRLGLWKSNSSFFPCFFLFLTNPYRNYVLILISGNVSTMGSCNI